MHILAQLKIRQWPASWVVNSDDGDMTDKLENQTTGKTVLGNALEGGAYPTGTSLLTSLPGHHLSVCLSLTDLSSLCVITLHLRAN